MGVQKHVVWALRASLAVGMVVGVSSPAIAAESGSQLPSDVDQVSTPGPDDLTWSQVAAMKHRVVTFGEPGVNTASAGLCTLDTGPVYKRSSSNGNQYGGVGGKPKTECTGPMASIKHSTSMYKTVWWGLQYVAGPFEPSGNFGSSSYEQKSVAVNCADLRETTFRMKVTGTGTFPDGRQTTGSAFEDGTVNCGTNP